jgi:hypothetical protein
MTNPDSSSIQPYNKMRIEHIIVSKEKVVRDHERDSNTS